MIICIDVSDIFFRNNEFYLFHYDDLLFLQK